MTDVFSRHAEPRQTEKARADQVRNHEGGFVFQVGDETLLNRFLTIGTEGGTFYVKERDLTRQNVAVVERMAAARDPRLVEAAVAISQAGRAPSNSQALFALAVAASSGTKLSKSDGTDEHSLYRASALAQLPAVARTGSHVMEWVKYAELKRGWGPALVKAVRGWFDALTPEQAAYQVLKYKQRNGWAQRDLIRLAHVQHSGSPAHQALWEYVAKGTVSDSLPALVHAAAEAQATREVKTWLRLIVANRSLSWEMLPSEALSEPEVWRALFESGNLPVGALVRNLGRMTTIGAIKPADKFALEIAAKLSDDAVLRKARLHPVNLLLALKTYASGHGMRGKGTWTPVSKVIDGLDAAFYAAFPHVEPAGKRTLIALDVSGSMTAPAAGLPMSCREVTAAMSMVVLRTEPFAQVMGFSHQFVPLNISARQRLDDVTGTISGLPFGGTDCSIPMQWAKAAKVEVDTFQIWTDYETYAGSVHPHRALEQYRQAMGIDARMQTIAITPTEFTIADPLDTRTLDVSGFDAQVAVLLADHARGSL
jgi:60 kDa SS-A/Ro ribonucleoprotein